MRYSLVILIFCLLSTVGFAQELDYAINGTLGKPVLKNQLINATSMKDINPDYPSSWIEASDYVSSKITATCNGVKRESTGENDKLNSEQQDLLKTADMGMSIDVEVAYKVKNSITKRIEVKTMNFSLSQVPDSQASFIGGDELLNHYLKENTLDLINQTLFNKFETAIVKFFIGEDGKTTTSELIISSGNKKVDRILLEAIKNMPMWDPAKDGNGNPVKQEFELNVGVLIGC